MLHEAPDPGFRLTALRAAVRPDGAVVALAVGRVIVPPEQNVPHPRERAWIVRCEPTCHAQSIFDDTPDQHRFEPVDAVVDHVGRVHLVASHGTVKHDEDGNETVEEEERWYDETGAFTPPPPGGPIGDARFLFDPQDRAVRLNQRPAELRIQRLAEKPIVLAPQMYHFDAAFGSDGKLRVLYHDPAAEALRLATVDLDTRQVTSVVLEGKEAGIESALLGTDADGEAVSLAYFYRNPFYKGLKVLRGKGTEWSGGDVDASSERNLGWQLHAARGADGSVFVTYLDDVLEKRRVARYYASLEELWKSTRPEPTGWESRPQLASFVGGAGVTYARWGLWSGDPGAQDGHASYDVSYDLASSRIGRVFFEGEIGSLKLGATYLHTLVGDELAAAGGASARRAFDLFTAVAGWDQLFLYQDVQLRLEWGTYRGLAHVSGDTPGEVVFDSPRRRIEVDLLSAFRLKVALAYEFFRGPFGAYVYGVRQGEKSYSLVGSAFEDASFHDVSLAIGYSLLDYTSKYETNVSRPFVDVLVGAGLSLASLEHEVPVDAPFESTRHAAPWFLTGDLEVGWLVQRRSYSMHGLGWFGRIGVRAHGLFYPRGAGKPDDEKDAAASDQAELRISRAQGYVGPYVDLGVVF